MSTENDGTGGKDFFWVCLGIALLVLLFAGDPDLADAIRVYVEKAATQQRN